MEVGSGTYSRVYLAHEDEQELAIKVIKKAMLSLEAKQSCMLYREIAALRMLHHPNIVELKEVINDEDSDNLFLVMQYIKGSSLDELTEKPTPREVWKWSR